MNYSRKKIEEILNEVFLQDQKKNLISSGLVKNIQIFGKEIELDFEIENPTLQYKRSVELKCINAIKKYYSDSEIKFNFTLKKKNTSVIKGNPIPNVKNIIAVSSAKGGVGKSTIAANLAVGLKKIGYNVGLVDADIYGPSMPMMFGLQEASPQGVKVNGRVKIKPLESHGVKLLSVGFFANSQQPVVWRGPMASKALNQLLWEADWGALDYMIIDLPPGTGDIHLSLIQSIPLTGAVVISTPQPIAIADARKGINMFRMDSINVPVLGIVENMSYFVSSNNDGNKEYIFGKDGAKNIASELKINLLMEIPILKQIREGGDIGRPVILESKLEISNTFLNLSKNLVSAVNYRNENLKPTKKVEITHNKGCSK